MAEIMKVVFGEKLLMHPVDLEGSLLPSPQDLIGKIIVKGKSFASPFSKKQKSKVDDFEKVPKARVSIKKMGTEHFDEDAYDVSEEDEAAEAADGAGEHWQNAMDNVRIDVLHDQQHGQQEEKRRQQKIITTN